MKNSLREGEKWSHLEVIGFETRVRVVDESPGFCMEQRQELAFLKCDCGKQIEIWVNDFKGRRRTRDCGCGMSLTDGAQTVTAFSAPVRTKIDVEKFARGRGWSFSKAIVELVRVGLENIDRPAIESSGVKSSEGSHEKGKSESGTESVKGKRGLVGGYEEWDWKSGTNRSVERTDGGE